MKTGRFPAWILLPMAVIVVGLGLGMGVRYLARQASARDLPPVPDLAPVAAAVREAVQEADRTARRSGSIEDVGRLARVYHANALHDPARVIYARLEILDPDNPRWPYYAAVLELRLGRNAAATTHLERTLELAPEHANAAARLGQLHYRSQRVEEAEAAFRLALTREPTHPHAAVGLARVFADREAWPQAVRVLEPAVQANPGYGPGHRMLALVYEAQGRAEDQARHERLGSSIGLEMRDPWMDELILESNHANVLITAAKIAQTWGDIARAERLFRRALDVAPDDVDVLLPCARFLADPARANAARMTEARSLLERAIRLDPGYLNVRHDYAMIVQALGDTTRAAAQWEEILGADPQHAMAWMSLGQIAFFRGQYDRARDLFRKGIDVPADTPYTLGDRALGLHRYGIASWRAGYTNAALVAFEEATEKNASLRAAWSDWARLLGELGREDEGVAVLERAVEAAPVDPELRLALGQYLLRRQRWAEAQTALDGARAMRPTDHRVLAALGYVTLQLGEVEPAITHLTEAVRVNPRFALAHFHLGNALVAAGLTQEAREHFETCAQLNPSFRPARDALQRMNGN